MRYRLIAACILGAAVACVAHVDKASATPGSKGRSGNVYGVTTFRNIYGIQRRLRGRELGIQHLDRRAFGVRGFNNHVFGVRLTGTGQGMYGVRQNAFGSKLSGNLNKATQRVEGRGIHQYEYENHPMGAAESAEMARQYAAAMAKMPK